MTDHLQILQDSSYFQYCKVHCKSVQFTYLEQYIEVVISQFVSRQDSNVIAASHQMGFCQGKSRSRVHHITGTLYEYSG